VHIADLSAIRMYHGEIVVRMIRVCPNVGWILIIFNTHLSRVFEKGVKCPDFGS
jgi:hypothetical protein